MKKVLVLCNRNSYRSQMAGAIVDACLGDKWQAFSAGTQPAGYVHSKAIAVLAEIGIQNCGASQHSDEFRDVNFGRVVTVCDDAENCPVWLGKGQRVHIGFPDPTKTDLIADFRKEGDEIKHQIVPFLEVYED